jgi:pyruvate formate lyase activating enzyme
VTTIVCDVCPRSCRLEEGQTGFCNVRKNVDGENVDALYGLFYPYPEEYNQYAPGSYTVVSPGCSLKCWFCYVPFTSSGFTGDITGWPGGAYRKLSPSEFVERVKASAGPTRQGVTCGLMGFFGGEPAIHYEYLLEASRLCHEAGCASRLHTNGYISEHIMRELAWSIDSISVNVKGSASPTVYREMGADPAPVLQSIKTVWENCRELNIRDITGLDLEASCEDVLKFGAWLRDNTSLDVFLKIEGRMASYSSFTEANLTPRFPENETYFLYRWRIDRIAELLVKHYGFTNIFIEFYPACGPVEARHYPDYAGDSVRMPFRFRVKPSPEQSHESARPV